MQDKASTDATVVDWMALGQKIFNMDALIQASQLMNIDSLDLLAFITGIVRAPEPTTMKHPGFNWSLHVAKRLARDGGHSWADMAKAMGEGQDRAAANRVQRRFETNEELLVAHRTKHGDQS